MCAVQDVSIDVGNKVERQIVCHQWMQDGKLLLSSRTGELLLCDVGVPDPELASVATAKKKAAGKKGNRETDEEAAKAKKPVDGPDQHARLLAEVGISDKRPTTAAVQGSWVSEQLGEGDDKGDGVEQLQCLVAASRLPLAAVDETEQARAGPWHLQANPPCFLYLLPPLISLSCSAGRW